MPVDGYDDLIVGAHNSDPGTARVFSGCDSLGTSYCSPAVVNSSGLPATIQACGSPSVTFDYLNLITTDVAPNQWGYYLMSETKGFVPNPGGSDGNLCLGGKIIRFAANPSQVIWSGPEGRSVYSPDLTDLPQRTIFQPGETWNFQLWFRDVVGTKFTSNFSDGVAITFD